MLVDAGLTRAGRGGRMGASKGWEVTLLFVSCNDKEEGRRQEEDILEEEVDL